VFQTYGRIRPEGQQLFFPVDALLQWPQLSAGRGDFNVRPSPGKNASGLFGWPGIGDGGIGWQHGSDPRIIYWHS
ncbi:MAG: hypothetical protein KDI45_15915, partial [Candidatus Accumulibacter sp.]|nr:hypothetical protein [Accumulibacter sp.]